jgi:hypothetical protein
MQLGGNMINFDKMLERFRSKKKEININVRPADQLKSDLLNCLIRYDQDTQLEALTSVVKKQFPLTWRVYRLHIIRNRKMKEAV